MVGWMSSPDSIRAMNGWLDEQPYMKLKMNGWLDEQIRYETETEL
jgi:hypothetical protein